ncbi:MAG: hypothetical protein AAFN70_13960, partial [Planctomycetota bacterium]
AKGRRENLSETTGSSVTAVLCWTEAGFLHWMNSVTIKGTIQSQVLFPFVFGHTNTRFTSRGENLS